MSIAFQLKKMQLWMKGEYNRPGSSPGRTYKKANIRVKIFSTLVVNRGK